MDFSVGSLVKARGREWVIQPESTGDWLIMRPLGGTEEETTGICTALELVETATFDLPSPDVLGDAVSSRLLRDAVRLGFRAGTGPFRSFARMAVEPRPYQLVPLLLALKLDPVRLLIADDVGVGKTIEAALIASEMIARGEITRMAVLCPPHLAEQWQSELRDKFHIQAELVLASTAPRLERDCLVGQSLFELYPFVVVSTDFIKSDRHREEFLRTCPEFVIVDEAHTCASGIGNRGGRHQRHHLIKKLAADLTRHIILVTATPHSGNEDAFRSLLALLNPEFANLPENLSGREHEASRRKLAAHFVQRRRGDIRHYMQEDTPFPKRLEDEESYHLSPDYRKLFDRVLEYARETVLEPESSQHRQRVRWWSALALLRALASSPAAAAATLRTRAAALSAETVEEADELGRRTVLDLDDDEQAERIDVSPGCDLELADDETAKNRRRLQAMAREADALAGEKDEKLKGIARIIKTYLDKGFRPILFCRFIATAEYVTEELRRRLPKQVQVMAVTGNLPPAEREARVAELAAHPHHVLVCTDCLSEGINLQEHFDAVIHYDLSWNPTRHEQREGRVDRYGQAKPQVRALTYYGTDNQIDGIVLDVLLRKHKAIRSSLGISVPVPINTNQVVEAIFEGLLLRGHGTRTPAQQLSFFDDEAFKPQLNAFHTEWEAAKEREEKRSRTLFAQDSIKVEEVKAQLDAVQASIGAGVDVERFVRDGFRLHKATVSANSANGHTRIDLSEIPRGLRDVLGDAKNLNLAFRLPVDEGVTYVHRTHPVVEALSAYVMDTALDSLTESVAKRAGVMMTRAVSIRTTVLLLRLRYHLTTRRGDQVFQSLAEECQILAFTGSPQNARWLDREPAEVLLDAHPDANIAPDRARDYLRKVVEGYDFLRPVIEQYARERGAVLLEAHRTIRQAGQLKHVRYAVEPQLPVDILGIYVYLPV